MTLTASEVFGVVEVKQTVTATQIEKVVRKALESASTQWLDINAKCVELDNLKDGEIKSEKITELLIRHPFSHFSFFRNTRTGELFSTNSEDFLDGVKFYMNENEKNRNIDNCTDKMADQIMQLVLFGYIKYK